MEVREGHHGDPTAVRASREGLSPWITGLSAATPSSD